MSKFPLVLSRRSYGVLFAVAGLLMSPLGSDEARADEVAPQVGLYGILRVSQSSTGAVTFGCSPSAVQADGSFTCGPNITGTVVGVTDAVGWITGHRVRLNRRVSSTVTESYVGALANIEEGIGQWIAGEYTRATVKTSCTRLNCIPHVVTEGPLPFTAHIFSIGG